MAFLQIAQIVATIALLCFAVIATGYSAHRLLTQDSAHPLQLVTIETLWTVPIALWIICTFVYFSLKG